MLDGLLHDLRDAGRSLLRHKTVSAVAALSLALAIGADSALFTLVDTYVLRGTGAVDPQQLVRVYQSGSDGEPWDAFSYLGFADHERATRTLSHLAVEAPRPLSVSQGGEAERVLGSLVSGSYFELVGRPASAGRLIGRVDDRLAEPSPVVVLGERYWRRRFAADPGVVGREVRVNGLAFRVIGVAPPEFGSMLPPLAPDLYVPVTTARLLDPTDDDLDNRGGRWLMAWGRLAAGATRPQAEAELSGITRALGRQYPADSGRFVTVIAESEGRVFPAARGPVFSFLGMLFAVITLVLLVACANVASLLLARGEARRQELSVRAALGAGRGRLVRQLLVESGVIGVGGALLGFVFAHVLCRMLVSVQPPLPIPITLHLVPDARVLAFAVSLGIVTSLVFGLMPALHATSQGLLARVRDGGGATTRRSRLRSALVVAQVALTLVLLGGAGLFLRALVRAQTLSPGFHVDHVAMASLDLPLSGYRTLEGLEFAGRVAERLAQQPGIEAVALADHMPLGLGFNTRGYAVEGEPVREGSLLEVGAQSVGPGYFQALGIPLRRGRDVASTDRAGAPEVVVVNEAFATLHWPGREAVGQRISWSGDGSGPWVTVVGVAANSSTRSLSESPRPFVYLPLAQNDDGQVTLIARGGGDPEALARRIVETARALDPDLLVFDAKSMARHLGVALLPVRLASGVFGALGLLALFLAAFGLFGLVAYAVSQRTREIGLRMVFGATREDIQKLMMGEGVRLAALGLALGLAAVLALGQLVRGFLHGVPPTDPLALGGVVALLGLAALFATWLPARRATRIEPVVALRSE